MPNYVPGFGSFDANLMIVGEMPGSAEAEAGFPLVGPSGQLTEALVEEAGMKWNETYRTNVFKYQAPFNDVKKFHLIGVTFEESAKRLWEDEILRIRPKCILALGDVALTALTGFSGIQNYRGSILHATDGVHKVVPTINLAALLNRKGSDDEENKGPLPWVYKKLISADIQRAVDESRTREFNLPERTLSIARNSLDVHRFFEEYRTLDKAACDIESINCIPVSISFAFNRHHALAIPLLKKIGSHPLTDMSRFELAQVWVKIQEEFLRLKLIGQNFKYDEFKLRLAGFRGFRLYSDTLLKVRTLFPEIPDARLCVQSSLWTREPYYKDDGKENKIGTKFNVDRFLVYNGRDSAVTFEVDEEQELDLVEMSKQFNVPLVDLFYNYVMRKHKLYLYMENVGFNVDHMKKLELFDTYTQMQINVHNKMTEQVGYEVNVKSYPQVHRLLYQAMKFKLMKHNPTSEDTIVALLGNHCKGKDAVKKTAILTDLLEERRIRDQKSRYINFTPDYDKRCKTIYRINGTETCRTSTAILDKPIRPKKIGLAFHTISKHGRLAKDIRSMFIPDEGKVFVQVDSSQAEARVVAVLSRDWDLLRAFDEIDIHRRTAGLLFQLVQQLVLSTKYINIVDDLPKDGPERFCGKKTRHAGNYDMKKRRFMQEFNTDAQKFDINMTISEWRAGQMLELFHEASPKIKSVFHKEIQQALDNGRVLIDPFGFPRVFNGKFDDDLYKEGYANIPQRTVSHLVQGAAIRASDEFNGDVEIHILRQREQDVYFTSESHDSLVIQAPINDWERYARVLKKYMQQPIDFSRYCTLRRDYVLTIPSDVEVSLDPKTGNVTNYGALHKYKIDLPQELTA